MTKIKLFNKIKIDRVLMVEAFSLSLQFSY